MFAAILPHTKLYGGVKRFFELGEAYLKLQRTFIVFTPGGKAPTWYTGPVPTQSLSLINTYSFDCVFITELQFLPDLVKAHSKRKVFYFVRPSDKISVLKKYPEVEVFANSTNGYEVARFKYGIHAFKAFGGINTKTYFPKVLQPGNGNEPFTILTYGRIVEKKKGTRLVVKACERLYKKGFNLKLLLFDTPVNVKAEEAIKNFSTVVPFEFIVNHPVNQNTELFHRADLFIAAERKTGYSNTSAEAMAAGLPVIATESGTKHFLIHEETGFVVRRTVRSIEHAIETLIGDFELRKRLAADGRNKIEDFSWESLAKKILEHLASPRTQNNQENMSFWKRLRYTFKY